MIAYKFLKILASYLYLFIDGCIGFIIYNNKTSTKTILVVRLDHVGDFLLSAPFIHHLRDLCVDCDYKLVLAGNASWVDIARKLNVFDEIIPIQRKKYLNSIWYRLNIIKKLNKVSYITVINATFSREVFWGDSIVHLVSAKEKIGFYGDNSNISLLIKKISDKFYTRLIKVDKDISSEIEINRALIHHLLPNIDIKLISIGKIISDHPCTLVNYDEYYGLAPGSSWSGKAWSPEKFALLSDMLYIKYGLRGVIFGNQHETKVAKKINQFAKFKLLDLTGMTNINELCSLISSAKFLISNDSGSAHIGAIVKTPTVVVLGGGHLRRFMPYESMADHNLFRIADYVMSCYGCNWYCSYKTRGEPVPCIKNISVELVFKKLNEIYC